MAVTLVGEIVNSADAVTGFNAGNISGDDDFVEGTGALGVKASATTQELYTTTLGATAPYNFSSGGGEEGYHMIIWFNTKTPIDTKANGGLAMIMGNGTDRGKWYVNPAGFYKGGFITRVIDPERDFDNIAAGTWTLAGNPAQLSNITQMGGGFVTTTSIMGSFNNVQIDQFTIGLGLRIDAGTGGTPNEFEDVRAADEDTAFYGWWGSSQGAIIGKGKLFMGPATGTATSVFRDAAVAIIFAEEDVAADFYEFDMRGANTEVTWELMNISIGGTARWAITLDSAMGSTTGGFTDTSSTFIEYGTITLNQYAELTGTTLIAGTRLVQNNALLDGITLTNANVATSVAAILSDNPADIKNGTFNANSGLVGHAIEIDTAGTYSFDNNIFNDYDAASPGVPGNKAIWFNPTGGTGNLVINVVNGGNISADSIRNSSSGSVTVNNTVTQTIQVDDASGNPVSGARVRVELASDGSQLAQGSTDAFGTFTDSTYNYGGDVDVVIKVRLKGFKNFRTNGTITSNGLSVGVLFANDPIVDLP
jgi:hypothetical protein